MRYRRDDYLFAKEELASVLEAMRRGIQDSVDHIPKEQFLSNSVDDVVAHISPRLKIAPLKLYEEAKTMENVEIKVDVSSNPNRNIFGDPGPIYVPGIRVSVSIPYSGVYDLWNLSPSTFRSTYPHGHVTEPNHDGIGTLNIVIEQPNDENPERIKEGLRSVLDDVRFLIDQQNKQIEAHNASIETSIKSCVEKRRERLKQHEKIAEMLEIPLKQDEKAPPIRPIHIDKIIQPLAPPPKTGLKSEPGVAQKIYEDILLLIRHVGRTFETTPKTYSVHDEEELRDILLANLNGHFKGVATGETFRKSGKTDIKIETEDRVAFIAECKIWKGQKEILEAVDQLLRYLIWRDCKATLIIFNKHNAKISELVETVPASLKTHSKMKRYIGQIDEGEWDFVFMSQEDEARLVQIRVFIFNIYFKNDK